MVGDAFALKFGYKPEDERVEYDISENEFGIRRQVQYRPQYSESEILAQYPIITEMRSARTVTELTLLSVRASEVAATVDQQGDRQKADFLRKLFQNEEDIRKIRFAQKGQILNAFGVSLVTLLIDKLFWKS